MYVVKVQSGKIIAEFYSVWKTYQRLASRESGVRMVVGRRAGWRLGGKEGGRQARCRVGEKQAGWRLGRMEDRREAGKM